MINQNENLTGYNCC